MIKSVHIPVYCPSVALKAGALLTFKTIRTGFPTVPIRAYWHGRDYGMFPELAALCQAAGVELVNQSEQSNEKLIRHLLATERESFALVDSDMVFFENCETFEARGLIAGEYIPPFVCPIAQAATMSRLHTAFFVVPDPARLRQVIWSAYRPCMARYCPFDPFAPVVTFRDQTPWFYDLAANLFHLLTGDGLRSILNQDTGAECFDANMLACFEHMYAGSYADAVSAQHAALLLEVFRDPAKAKGFRNVMTKFFEERKI